MTIVMSLESDNQLLLSLYYKWSVWADFLICVDKCYGSTEGLFTSNKLPDLAFATVSKMYIIELTVCFETNLISSREYKVNWYAQLKETCIEKNREVELIFIEISSLGFYTEHISVFKRFPKDLNLNSSRIFEKYIETCI